MGEDANGKGFESYPTGDSVSENHPTPCKRLFFRPTESYPKNVMIGVILPHVNRASVGRRGLRKSDLGLWVQIPLLSFS